MKKILLSLALALGILSGYAQGGPGYNGGGRPPHSNGGGNHGGGGYNGGGHNGGGHGHGHNGGWNNPQPMPMAMSQADFSRALQMVDDQRFESDRLMVAKQVSRNNLMTASQVAIMADVFSFESSRLEFAKFAYDFCFDRQNFYQVNRVFRFSSSISELDRYIASRGPAGPSYGYNGGAGNVVVTTYSSGGGNGMSYNGGVTSSAPACPQPNPGTFCSLCNHYHSYPYACEASFRSILGAIEDRQFDSDRIVLAKQIIRDRVLSADQVRRIMLAFTFESYKLDFAKAAYHNTFDQENFYVVNSAFTFSSSVRELDAYIRHC